MTPLSVMAMVTAHTDHCDQCLRMEPCDTGRKLVRWSIQRLAELMAPIPGAEEAKD